MNRTQTPTSMRLTPLICRIRPTFSWWAILGILGILGALLATGCNSPNALAKRGAKMEEAGFRVTGTSREDFARIIAADTVTWGRAVAATGFSCRPNASSSCAIAGKSIRATRSRSALAPSPSNLTRAR